MDLKIYSTVAHKVMQKKNSYIDKFLYVMPLTRTFQYEYYFYLQWHILAEKNTHWSYFLFYYYLTVKHYY